MCVRTIVDASAFRHLCEPTKRSAGHQLRRWIARGDGVVAYSPVNTDYADELNEYTDVRDLLHDYNQRGLAIDIDAEPIQTALTQVPGRPLRRSDDPHILALAIASDATVLFTCDSRLGADFANHQVLRKIGQKRRSSMPGLVPEVPADTMGANNRRKFLENRKCPSPR